MIPSQRLKEALVRLKNNPEFGLLTEFLTETQKTRQQELEDATTTVGTHKLQGYCQALRELIKICS